MEVALAGLDKAGVLGAVVSISVPGRDPVTVSRGYVDIERQIPMDTSRLFQIGSQTKMFTAAALLLLERDGKLQLDDLVSMYVPDLPRPNELTIRQLLTHTGGIGDSVTFFDPPAGQRPDFHVSFENHLFLGKVAGEQFEPGADWMYNNFGFIVLGRVIEAASGMTLDAYTQQNILEPMGMHDTYLGYLETYPYERMARGYFGADGAIAETTQPGLSWASSAGDMISSVADMHRWANMLRGEDNPLGLSLSSFDRDPVPVEDFGNLTGYGLGMMRRDLGGYTMWGHGGFIHGYVTLMLLEPESGTVVQLMTSLQSDSDKIVVAVESVTAIALNLAEYWR